MFRAVLTLITALIAAPGPSWAEAPDSQTLRQMFARPDRIPYPSGNSYTAERETLGRILFFDPRLSSSNLLSCASCHNPSFGWGDGQSLGRGHGMTLLTRRSPTILNAAWGKSFFWDGRALTLEDQAFGPLAAPTEMNMPLEKLAGKISAIPGYRPLFEAAYPGQPISLETIVRAIATFERGIVSGEAPFDRWVRGDDKALSPAQRRGLDVFVGPARCAQCHKGWNFTDGAFHNVGLNSSDRGRIDVDPDNPQALNAFKTPTLRDATKRAPFMHDGSLPTLESVIRFRETGGGGQSDIQPIKLSDQERADLLAFLETLSAPSFAFAAPTLPR